VTASLGETPTRHVAPVAHGTLERTAGSWHIELGNRSATLEHVVGLSYLAELVAKPDTDISAADPGAVVAGGRPIDRGQSGAPLIDERPRDEYGRRPAHLERELETADRLPPRRRRPRPRSGRGA
jgi:hypothetical protein